MLNAQGSMLNEYAMSNTQCAMCNCRRRSVRLAFCIAHWALSIAVVAAQQGPGGFTSDPGMPSSTVPRQLQDVTFEQRLNEHLPFDAMFRDEADRPVALRDYFGRRPVVLAFVYFQCPMLCTQVLNGVSSAVKALTFTPGTDFEVVFISFDPRDTPQAAAAKKKAQLEDYKQVATAGGWHFLTGDEPNIRRVTSAAGFNYRWDSRSGQFAHVSGLLIVTPDGRLSRYFYGVEYSPKELRMALVESGEGRVGSAVDKLLLYCYHYDPATGRYGVIAMNLVRLGGVLTVALLAGFILLMRWREGRTPLEGRA
jgi:protein SCO1